MSCCSCSSQCTVDCYTKELRDRHVLYQIECKSSSTPPFQPNPLRSSGVFTLVCGLTWSWHLCYTTLHRHLSLHCLHINSTAAGFVLREHDLYDHVVTEHCERPLHLFKGFFGGRGWRQIRKDCSLTSVNVSKHKTLNYFGGSAARVAVAKHGPNLARSCLITNKDILTQFPKRHDKIELRTTYFSSWYLPLDSFHHGALVPVGPVTCAFQDHGAFYLNVPRTRFSFSQHSESAVHLLMDSQPINVRASQA